MEPKENTQPENVEQFTKTAEQARLDELTNRVQILEYNLQSVYDTINRVFGMEFGELCNRVKALELKSSR